MLGPEPGSFARVVSDLSCLFFYFIVYLFLPVLSTVFTVTQLINPSICNPRYSGPHKKHTNPQASFAPSLHLILPKKANRVPGCSH